MNESKLKPPAFANEFAAAALQGTMIATQGAMDKYKPTELRAAMIRHLSLDWSDMDDEDQSLNLQSAMEGCGRVLGAFRVHAAPHEPCDLWIITEHQNAMTTVLLPEEY